MAVNVGNPHLVFFVDAIDEAIGSTSSARASSMTRPFPSGSTSMSPRSRDDGIHLRTWERGAGLTLACGTGACATAVAAIVQKKADVAGQGRHAGGALTIAWAPGEPIRMRGAATHVFTGEIDLEAFA